MAIYPSPYQSKDDKLKEIKKTYGLSYKNMFDPAHALQGAPTAVRPTRIHKPKGDSISSKTSHTKPGQQPDGEDVSF